MDRRRDSQHHSSGSRARLPTGLAANFEYPERPSTSTNPTGLEDNVDYYGRPITSTTHTPSGFNQHSSSSSRTRAPTETVRPSTSATHTSSTSHTPSAGTRMRTLDRPGTTVPPIPSTLLTPHDQKMASRQTQINSLPPAERKEQENGHNCSFNSTRLVLQASVGQR
jgi:hypothetical protein